MSSEKRMVTVTIDGTTFEVERDSPLGKRVLNALEEKREEELAKFVTSAAEKLFRAIEVAHNDLGANEQLALATKSIYFRFNGRGVSEKNVLPNVNLKVMTRVRGGGNGD